MRRKFINKFRARGDLRGCIQGNLSASDDEGGEEGGYCDAPYELGCGEGPVVGVAGAGGASASEHAEDDEGR